MKRNVTLPLLALTMLLMGAADSGAEVKRVRMRVTGYLCNFCAYNIQKAVGRLDYAPHPEQVRLVDFRQSVFAFVPKPDKSVSFAALRTSVDGAGYALYSAEITVAGTLAPDGERWSLVVAPTGQRFTLDGKNLNKLIAGAPPGTRVEINGGWKTIGSGAQKYEVISPRTLQVLAEQAK